jgi:hypothetical protein
VTRLGDAVEERRGERKDVSMPFRAPEMTPWWWPKRRPSSTADRRQVAIDAG